MKQQSISEINEILTGLKSAAIIFAADFLDDSKESERIKLSNRERLEKVFLAAEYATLRLQNAIQPIVSDIQQEIPFKKNTDTSVQGPKLEVVKEEKSEVVETIKVPKNETEETNNVSTDTKVEKTESSKETKEVKTTEETSDDEISRFETEEEMLSNLNDIITEYMISNKIRSVKAISKDTRAQWKNILFLTAPEGSKFAESKEGKGGLVTFKDASLIGMTIASCIETAAQELNKADLKEKTQNASDIVDNDDVVDQLEKDLEDNTTEVAEEKTTSETTSATENTSEKKEVEPNDNASDVKNELHSVKPLKNAIKKPIEKIFDQFIKSNKDLAASDNEKFKNDANDQIIDVYGIIAERDDFRKILNTFKGKNIDVKDTNFQTFLGTTFKEIAKTHQIAM